MGYPPEQGYPQAPYGYMPAYPVSFCLESLVFVSILNLKKNSPDRLDLEDLRCPCHLKLDTWLYPLSFSIHSKNNT